MDMSLVPIWRKIIRKWPVTLYDWIGKEGRNDCGSLTCKGIPSIQVHPNHTKRQEKLGSNLSRNRKFYQLKTSFYQLSNMASSGLKKMLTFIILCELFGKILVFTIFNTLMLCVDLFFTMVCLMSIVIVDRCCIYYCGRYFCQYVYIIVCGRW